MPLARRIAKNTVYLLSSNVASGIISFILLFVIAKKLGSVEFGKFSFAKALPQLFIVIADMGISILAIREIARDKLSTIKFLGQGLILKGFLSIVALFIVYVSLLVIRKDPDIIFSTMLLTIFFIATSFITFLYSFFKAHEEMGFPTFFLILDKSILILVIIYLTKSSLLTLNSVIYTYLGVEISVFLITFITIIHRYGCPKIGIDLKYWKELLNISWPFALGSVFFLILTYCDQVLLSIMKEDKVVGCYGFSYTLIQYSGFIPSAFMGALYPVMSRFSVTSRNELTQIYLKAFKYMLLFGAPVAVGYYMLAPQIINFVGNQYLPSILTFRILAWAWLFSEITIVMVNLVYVLNKQKISTLFAGICAVINIILDLLLIPRFSLYGAAYATLITALLYCFLFYIFVAMPFCGHKQFIRVSIKSLASAAVMAIVLYKISAVNIFAQVILGAFIYFVCILCLKVFNKEDWFLFKRIFRYG